MTEMEASAAHHEVRKGKPKTFSCPNCAGSVTIHAVGHSVSAICAYCSSVIDVSNENLKILQTAHTRIRPTLLTLGKKGVLKGIHWEIIGYMEKSNLTGYFRWDEYLLYNPYHGFRFLMQNNGHWTLFKVLKKAINETGDSSEIKLDGKKYKRFEQTHTKVAYVKGEFYWRARTDEESVVTDYIAPPYMLSISQNDEEINIALGEYIDAKTIETAFALTETMPHRSGIAPNQLGRFTWDEVANLWFTAIIGIMLAFVIQLITSASADNATVYSTHFDITPAEKSQTLSTESFTLPKKSNLLITSNSPLKDEWLELNLALVNEQDDTVLEATQAIEFYTGMDYDGYWSEGNQATDSLFSAVPKGKYKLLIDADSGAFPKNNTVTFNISIKRDVSSWSNFWLTFLMLLIYPIIAACWYRYTEYRRWSDSIVYEIPGME